MYQFTRIPHQPQDPVPCTWALEAWEEDLETICNVGNERYEGGGVGRVDGVEVHRAPRRNLFYMYTGSVTDPDLRKEKQLDNG